jgi:hypothetical protein
MNHTGGWMNGWMADVVLDSDRRTVVVLLVVVIMKLSNK